jgi:energy-coupling factor transporter ATP-binding protein EcfA2
MQNKMELRNDACFQIVGPSGSGKTHFVCALLQSNLFKKKFNKIYWHYGSETENGATAKSLGKLKGIKFIEGFDSGWKNRLREFDVVVIDDLYQESNNEAGFNNLFTKISRHVGVTVIFITQNLFHNGGQHRTRNINMQYLVLFKNPRDQTVVDFLARQAFPSNKKFLIESFADATCPAHGYLFLDFTQSCPEDLRVRTSIFDNKVVVYKQN